MSSFTTFITIWKKSNQTKKFWSNGEQNKEEGKDNDLLERIAIDDAFNLSKDDIASLLEHNLYIGRSKEQVTEFIEEFISPILEEHKEILGRKVKLKV